MICKVRGKIIEMILSREMKFNDFNFRPYTWEDSFIVELLRWFDNKYIYIPMRKLHGPENAYNFIHWKTYYEQIVRIFYNIVIVKNIQDSKQLNKIFSYLFSVDKNDNPYRDSFDIISSEKLMNIYEYLIKNTGGLKEYSPDRDYIDVLIGRWNTKEMKNKLDNIRANEDNSVIKIVNNDIVINELFKMDDCNKSDFKTELDK